MDLVGLCHNTALSHRSPCLFPHRLLLGPHHHRLLLGPHRLLLSNRLLLPHRLLLSNSLLLPHGFVCARVRTS